jgi:hypothetical protein
VALKKEQAMGNEMQNTKYNLPIFARKTEAEAGLAAG